MTQRIGFKTLIGIAFLLTATTAFSADNIYKATRNENLQEVEKMIAANHSLVNGKNELGSTPLHIAASNASPAIAKLLLDKGANVNAKDNNGATPLHMAAFTGRKDNVQLLLSHGANVHAKDNKGGTARDYADQVLNREVADFLLIKMLSTPSPAPKK